MSRRLNSLEGALRTPAAQRLLEALKFDQVVPLLEEIVALREAGDTEALTALAVLGESLYLLGEVDRVTDLLAYARATHAETAARMLARPLPLHIFDPLQEKGVDLDLRAQTLGYRKALARTASREMLRRLLQDPSDLVIRILLEHPKLVEADVVLLAARRPARAEIQREIYLSRRWKMQRSVRRALVSNPYTPPEMGLKLMPLLPLADAQSLAKDRTLHPAVQAAAGARVVAAKKRAAPPVSAQALIDMNPEGEG